MQEKVLRMGGGSNHREGCLIMASIKKIQGKGGVSYKITVSMGRDALGNQIRHYKTWRPDRPMPPRQMEKEAKQAAFEFERELEKGFLPDSKQTFSEYAEYIFSLREQRGDRAQTLSRVRRQMERINKYIGNMKLVDIRPQHLNEMYKKMAEPGANTCRIYAAPAIDFNELLSGDSFETLASKCGVSWTVIRRLCHGQNISLKNADKVSKNLGRNDLFTVVGAKEPLSPGTIRSYHGVVSMIFGNAEKEMIVQYNPAKRVTLPKMKKIRGQEAIQPDALRKILEALDGERIDFKTLVHLLIVTGCRRGEVLALTWSDVDFEAGQIFIDKSVSYLPEKGIYCDATKTGNSRYVSIPKETVLLLRQYRAWQSEQRLSVGDLWENNDLVFSKWNGTFLYPASVNIKLSEFCKRNGFPSLHPHLFRHTVASILLSNGIDVLSVSKILGHSSPNMTMRVYAHEIEDARRKGAECISDVILCDKRA